MKGIDISERNNRRMKYLNMEEKCREIKEIDVPERNIDKMIT